MTRDCVRFETFLKKCQQKGLQAKECSPWHWQVLGGKFLVNYFHGKNGASIHLGKTNHSIAGSDELAIKYANELPKIEPSKRKYSGYSKYKKRLFRKSNICSICKKGMNYEDASIDHIIPISKGGMNNPANYQLTHAHCNSQKGDNV